MIKKLIILSILLIGTPCWALNITASLNKNLVYLGDKASISVTINADVSGQPVIPQVDGLQIRMTSGPSRSFEQRVTIGSGGYQQNISKTTIRYGYEVSASGVGTYKIPPFKLIEKGKTYLTDFLTLTVSKAPKTNEMKLKQVLEKSEVFVRTPVKLILKWYMTKNEGVGDYYINLPIVNNPGIIVKDIPKPQNGKKQNLKINGNTTIKGWITVENIKGISYIVFNSGILIFPKEPGILKLQPPSVKAQIITGYKKVRDWFSIRNIPQYKTLYATGNSEQLNVKSLPLYNKPDNFSNLVGQYSVSTKLNYKKVNVGDPMILTINIKGTGLMELVEMPDIDSIQEIKSQFDIGKDASSGKIEADGSKTFTVTIRAKSDEVKGFPSIMLNYFNPESGKYENSHSKPIPLTVLPTVQVTGADVVMRKPSANEVKGVEKTEIHERAGGIMANYTEDKYILQDQSPDSWILIFSLVPPVIFTVLFFFTSYRNRLKTDSAFARKRQSIKKLRSGITGLEKNDANFSDRAARIVTDYISDILNLPPGEITVGDIQEFYKQKKLGKNITELASNILSKCEETRFSSAELGNKEKKELIDNLKKMLKLKKWT